VTAASVTLLALNGVVGSSVLGGAKNLLVGGDNTDRSFLGAISGSVSGSLAKQGSGIFALGGVQPYTGATILNAGTLQIDGDISASSGTTVNGGILTGTGTLGPVTLNATGTIAAGTDGTIGSISLGSLATNLGSILKFDINTTTILSDTINVVGALTLGGNPTLDLNDLGGDQLLPVGSSFTLMTYGAPGTPVDRFTYGAVPLNNLDNFVYGNNLYRIDYAAAAGTAITISTVNEAPTDIAVSPLAVDENSTIGTVVGTISGSDRNPGQSATLTFSLVPGFGDNSSFVVDGTNLKTNGALDFEVKPTYSVRLRATDSGAPGLTYEESFTITVNDLNEVPTITDIADLSTDEDVATAALAFTIDDQETAPSALVVSVTSSNTTLVPVSNIVLGGSGGSRNVAVTPVASLSGSATITVKVSDGVNEVSDAFVLTVNPINDTPSFTKGADQLVKLTITAPQVVTGWAIAIADGDADYTQGLTFNVAVTSDPDNIFTVAPAISAAGDLTYTLDGVGGTATISVTLTDDATAGGAAVTTAAQTFTITQAASTNSSLGSVAVSAGALSPTFTTGNTGPYALTLTSTDETLSVTPTGGDIFSVLSVRVNGGAWVPVASGSPSAPLTLDPGDNTVEIRVVAQDGSTETIYSIAADRVESVNADLASMVLSAGTLSPAFASATTI
jgi:autotransporter-associated beta strand protein